MLENGFNWNRIQGMPGQARAMRALTETDRALAFFKTKVDIGKYAEKVYNTLKASRPEPEALAWSQLSNDEQEDCKFLAKLSLDNPGTERMHNIWIDHLLRKGFTYEPEGINGTKCHYSVLPWVTVGQRWKSELEHIQFLAHVQLQELVDQYGKEWEEMEQKRRRLEENKVPGAYALAGHTSFFDGISKNRMNPRGGVYEPILEKSVNPDNINDAVNQINEIAEGIMTKHELQATAEIEEVLRSNPELVEALGTSNVIVGDTPLSDLGTAAVWLGNGPVEGDRINLGEGLVDEDFKDAQVFTPYAAEEQKVEEQKEEP